MKVLGLCLLFLFLTTSYCQQVSNLAFVFLRLAPFNNPQIQTGEGILEYYYSGRWLRVCDSNWGLSESLVACGQLGYPGTTNKFINRRFPHQRSFPSPIGVARASCSGLESRLSDCLVRNNLVREDFRGSRCSGQAVALSCQASNNNQRKEIRLRGGALNGEGRVQMLRSGKWGSVCSNKWTLTTANVACRQLGFGTARTFYTSTRFGRGHGAIWYTNVTCRGTEQSLGACDLDLVRDSATYYNNYTGPGCSQFQLASVSCFVPNHGLQHRIQLLDGGSPFRGRVVAGIGETNVWASICSGSQWTLKEARVVCRQLGFGFALRAIKSIGLFSSTTRGLRATITQIACKGNESSLSECQYQLRFRNQHLDCGREFRLSPKFVGVECSNVLPDLQLDVDLLQSSVRLRTEQLHRLKCAASEGCLSASADALLSSGRHDNTTRSLLQFSTSAWNRGTANFRPWQHSRNWEFHKCHNHYHSMQEFSHYDLLHERTLEKVAEGHKASFCLADSVCDRYGSRRFSCGLGPNKYKQGIAVGCTDIYLRDLDCQWIDITDIEPGRYILRIHINPQQLVAETDYANNRVVCDVTYTGTSAQAQNCYMLCLKIGKKKRR